MPQSRYTNLLLGNSSFSSLESKNSLRFFEEIRRSTVITGFSLHVHLPKALFAAANQASAHAGSAKQGGMAMAAVADNLIM